MQALLEFLFILNWLPAETFVFDLLPNMLIRIPFGTIRRQKMNTYFVTVAGDKLSDRFRGMKARTISNQDQWALTVF